MKATSEDGNRAQDQRDAARVDVDVDPAALREFEALRDFLAGLPQRAEEECGPKVSSVLASVVELEQISRWRITLHGVRRLTEIPALREEILRVPFCVAVRVTGVSSRAIELVVTTTQRLDRMDLETIIADSLEQIGSRATAQIALPVAAAAD